MLLQLSTPIKSLVFAFVLLGLQACNSDKQQGIGIHASPSSAKWTQSESIALQAAISRGDFESVAQMLKDQGNADAVAANGATPLYALFRSSSFPGGSENRYKIAEAIFRVGANPNELLPPRLSAGGVPVANWALHRDPVPFTRLFLMAGLKPNLTNAWNQTVLDVVVQRNSTEAAELLLAAGADINHLDDFKQNCLFHTTTQKTGLFLVARGVNISQRNEKGQSIVAKLRDPYPYCGSAGCTPIPPEELALADYLESIGAPKE